MHIAFISLYDTGAAGLRSISAFLKSHGHRVSIIFYGEMGRTHKEFHQFSKIVYQNAPKWCYEKDQRELIETLKQLNPDLIGISLRSAFFPTAIKLTKELKNHLTVPILWGGIHPTICPEESIQHTDVICLGEGEFPMWDLLSALEKKEPIRAIPNLWVKDGGEVVKNDFRLLNDPNQLPFPDYTETDKYYICAHPFDIQRYSIMTSRGCPFSCTFCSSSILREIYRGKGKYVQRRSIENVISELEMAKKTFPVYEVIFQDEIFVDDPEWLYPFLEEYKEKIHIPFACYLHSRYVKEPIIWALKEAGLYTACLGIQSGSERIRQEVYHRRQSNEEILRCAHLLNREIGMAYDFIVDNPFETKEDLIKSIQLLLQFPHPFRIHLATLSFFPNYPITKAAIENGLIQGPNYDTCVDEMLMIYKKDRPQEIQSLYFLMAATQHPSVDRNFIRKALEEEKLLNHPKKLFHLLDAMIKECDYVHDYRKRERNFECLEGIEKALVIPSGELATLSAVLERLIEKYPSCVYTLLTGKFPKKYCAILTPEKIRSLTEKERHPLEVTVYSGNSHGPRILGLDRKWIRSLREKKFDVAVLIHENMEGRGYIHVELLALLIGAKEVLIFKPDQSIVKLNPFSFIKKAIERKTRGRQERSSPY